MPEIITLGETMFCIAPKTTGMLRYMKEFEAHIAGAESNFAIGVSKMGHSAGWISRLGTDEIGNFILNSIRAEGVDTSQVEFDAEYRTGLMVKQSKMNGETSVFYYRDHSAACHLERFRLRREYFEGAELIHLTGVTPVLSRSCEEKIWELFELAAELCIPVSFDPNIRLKLWKGRDYSDVLREMMLRASIVCLGEEEAEILLGTNEAEEVFRSLFARSGIKYAALKQGEKGACVSDGNRMMKISSYPCRCVDPVGAGDAFDAAFVCGILEKKSLELCGEMAAVAGAMATESHGDTEGVPSREMMEDILGNESVVYR